MSANEALQLQVDNLRHQLHQLQVENEKLRMEVSTSQGDDTAEIGQLREEISELRQLLHEAQEREVSSIDLLDKSRNECNELKTAYDVVELKNEWLTSKSVEYRARYKQTCEELKRVRDSTEAERHRALEEEHVKWERREATLYAQLELAHTSVVSCTGTQVVDTVPVHAASGTIAVTSALSPMVGFARTIETPHVSEAASVSVTSGLQATASAFTPITEVLITCLSGGASSLPLSVPLWRPMRAPLSTGVAMTAATTGSSHSLVSSSLRSSAG